MSDSVKRALDRGITVLHPSSVQIREDVQIERIAPDVVIHPGCRIRGADTSIGPGCEIGSEAPATVENCQLGREVRLKGGYFSGATFLDRSSMGSCAHVRPGTLLEEEANGAHSVGLKQTILLPFVTAGSLINFCDCLMSGGTSRKDHSEIGSSYIHFNYSPHGDKATASLVGDVPQGVMLDRRPIFLGGQGGMVGPRVLAFGTVVAAGVICRNDVLAEGQLILDPSLRPENEPRRTYRMGLYGPVERTVLNCLRYIGNIKALREWYLQVRQPFMKQDLYQEACYAGAVAQLDSVLSERIGRLGDLAGRMERSLDLVRESGGAEQSCRSVEEQRSFRDSWGRIRGDLEGVPDSRIGGEARAEFLSAWEKLLGQDDYLDAVRLLNPGARSAGTAWLDAIVGSVTALWQAPEA
ncbi:MAG: UDP-N-acetylglucosamine pyrophosphorylase [Verrucomicrobia bacterium]|nr:UDP-N-acetylglucosamine pyrophosphorylase [Verrucomicrobiota bacterium]